MTNTALMGPNPDLRTPTPDILPISRLLFFHFTFMAFNKIQKKIVLPFALLVITFFVVTTYIVVRIIEHSLEQGFLEVTGSQLLYASELMKKEGYVLVNYAQFLADNPKISENLNKKNLLIPEAVPVLNRFGLDFICFVNQKGDRVLTLSYDAQHVLQMKTVDFPEERQLISWGLVGVNNFLFAQQGGVLYMMAVAPTKSRQGINGAVLVGKALDTAFLEGLKGIIQTDIGVYGPQATIFAGTYEEDKNRCLECHAPDWNILKISRGFHPRVNLEGKSFFISSEIKGYRYGYIALEVEGSKVAMVGIKNSYQALAGAKKRIYLLAVLAFFASMGFLIGVANYLARRITEPLMTLATATKKLAEGDLEQRVSVKTGDEIEGLAESFNYMAVQLRSWQEANYEKERMLQKYHQQQMERAAHLASMGELAAGIAHEIKNPLTGIMGAVQILEEEFEYEDPRREITGEIMLQLQRLDKTVRDLLSYARPAPPEFNPADINQVLQRVFFLVEQQPEAKTIKLIKKLFDNLPTVFLDAKQMQQVLLNVLLNALQAMPKGGELTVESFYEADKLRVGIKITDTGQGIPEHILLEIFKPFYTTKHKGTGLGLSITKGIVERHGGEIIIDSNPGYGTTVSIYLPVEGVKS